MDPVTLRALEADLIARLADDVAHEVRNPLNALVINFEVLRRRVTAGDTNAALERIDVLAGEVHRIHRIIERIIMLLRPARATETHADLRAACDDVFPLIALRAGARRASFELANDTAAEVSMSRGRLRLILLDSGMAALDLAGPAGHLSCIGPDRAGAHRFIWRASGAASERPSPGSEASMLRLTRAILAETGGNVELRAGADGSNEIVLLLPPVA